MVLFVFLEVGPSILFLVFSLFWMHWFIYDWQGLVTYSLYQCWVILDFYEPFGFDAIKQIRAVPISGPVLPKKQKQNPLSGFGFDSNIRPSSHLVPGNLDRNQWLTAGQLLISPQFLSFQEK